MKMTIEKLLQKNRAEAKELWLDYLECNDLFKSSKILKRWKRKMGTVHRLQTSVNALYFNYIEDEKEQYDDVKINDVQDIQTSSLCYC